MPPMPEILKEFRAFILRGNLVDLAIAVVIGAAAGLLGGGPLTGANTRGTRTCSS